MQPEQDSSKDSYERGSPSNQENLPPPSLLSPNSESKATPKSSIDPEMDEIINRMCVNAEGFGFSKALALMIKEIGHLNKAGAISDKAATALYTKIQELINAGSA